MAIDFIICVLLLISLAINLLALGAFWVTPGLRTTANRFVINLLVVNIIGSIALAPILFLNSTSNNNDSVINSSSTELNSFIATETINQINNTTKTLSKAVQCNNSRCETIIVESDRNSNRILIAELENDHYGDHNDIYDNSDDSISLPPESDEHFDDNSGDEEQPIFEGDYYETDEDLHKSHSHDHRRQYQSRSETSSKRCWSLDLAAALGALSVLLVVGDTWCAVTDPLRYHSRISGLKAWILIAITWFLGIFFGVLSALRDNAFVSTNSNSAPLASRQDQEFIVKSDPMQIDYSSVITIHPNELYNMIFSCFYFIVIILLPFGFVCGMYWRIFSEARENGLRMRQNGSSPLLQSALNLSPSANQNQMVKDQSSMALNTGISGGLTMKIDRTSSEKEVTKPLLMGTPVHKPSHHSSGEDNLNMDLEEHQHHHIIRPDRNQNILLTLSTANDELRRNYSARQLYLLGSSQDLTETSGKPGGLRQVHSTPNFQKFVHGFTASVGDPHHHHNSHHALQLPSVHIPPKALSYMTSIRHRLSNASSLFKYREESRAARISILVVIMFLISYLPYGLLVLLQSRITNLFANSTQVAIFMVLMAYLSSPFIFAYRNKRVRRGVKRLFGLDAKYRERKIHRSGGLLRAGTKASINVRRSASKASTYSVSSCKYLTPHAVSNGTFIMEVEKSHYLKNGYQLPQQQQLLLNGKDNFIASDKCDQSHQTILKDLEKRSILKKVCDSSRKLGCATNSCATSDNEQTDV